ncbi:MAG TPA: RNA-binding protein [Desulfuromonadales bacterium]|nr:RNA-binding protein [Desulfuromonadales bacterium]
MAKELYVGHISEQATEEDLRKLFEIMGVVTSVHLIVDEQTGEFKRCGYVRMLSEVNLNEVVETLDGTYLIDRCIVVSIAKPQKDRPAKTPFVKRTPKTGARPASAARPAAARPAAARPAATESGAGSTRNAAAKPAKSARPAVKEATKTGRSSAAKDAVRKFRPKATKDAVAGGRPASAANSPGRPPAGKRQSSSPRPPSKGRG